MRLLVKIFLVELIIFIELNKWAGRNLMCGSLDYAHPINLLREELKHID